MRTLLSQFCDEFEQVVRPLLDPLRKTASVLTGADVDLPGRALRAQFSDLGLQMNVLADKVAEQQAYVLIFGPLKSGKSTLMNALASSYVSEVTSLPAYPCMVYVSHSPKKEFTVTRYDSSTEMFADGAALHMSVSRAHKDLAERIRSAEDQGLPFDPAQHFPEAIRRIDVKLPAGDLGESGAVLVDTPGLYSRMKFGYDRMTRDFRNVAACAIFVVKSDNLFLEQVFQEFTELLELFNRIFLVVNLDTAKRDLDPQGQLVPSLERKDPLRIIEAFESLSMAAPLKTARDEGRLNIYPVDLLGAASDRLQDQEGEATESEDFRGPSNFDAFLSDLTEYLNSTDYLVAFLGDSLRRATSLLSEARDACHQPSVDRLREHVKKLSGELAAAERRHDAADGLREFDWETAFGELEAQLGQDTEEKAREIAGKTSRALDGAIDHWFHTDASLQDLIDAELVPLLNSHQEEVSMVVRNALDDTVTSGDAGIGLSGDVMGRLRDAGLDLSGLGKRCLEGLDRSAASSRLRAPLKSDTLPVKKSIWDWLFFRSRSSVRRRIFGPEDGPSVRISVESKKYRLGEAGKEALRRELDAYKGKFFPGTLERVHERVLGNYTRSTVDTIGIELTEAGTQLAREIAGLEKRLGGHRTALEHITDLEKRTRDAMRAIGDIEANYVQTDPDMLIQPVGAKAIPKLPADGPIGAPSEKKLEDAT